MPFGPDIWNNKVVFGFCGIFPPFAIHMDATFRLISSVVVVCKITNISASVSET